MPALVLEIIADGLTQDKAKANRVCRLARRQWRTDEDFRESFRGKDERDVMAAWFRRWLDDLPESSRPTGLAAKAKRDPGKVRLQDLVDEYQRGELRRSKLKKQCEELAGCEVEFKDGDKRKNWGDVVIHKGLTPLLKRVGDTSFDVLGPFGLFRDMSVHAKKRGYLEFRVRLPEGTKRGFFEVRVPKASHNRFKPGTVGYINGGNEVYRRLPDQTTVAHLVQMVRSRKAYRRFIGSYGTVVRTSAQIQAALDELLNHGK